MKKILALLLLITFVSCDSLSITAYPQPQPYNTYYYPYQYTPYYYTPYYIYPVYPVRYVPSNKYYYRNNHINYRKRR